MSYFSSVEIDRSAAAETFVEFFAFCQFCDNKALTGETSRSAEFLFKAFPTICWQMYDSIYSAMNLHMRISTCVQRSENGCEDSLFENELWNNSVAIANPDGLFFKNNAQMLKETETEAWASLYHNEFVNTVREQT